MTYYANNFPMPITIAHQPQASNLAIFDINYNAVSSYLANVANLNSGFAVTGNITFTDNIISTTHTNESIVLKSNSANVYIGANTDYSGGKYWNFDVHGDLILPNNGVIKYSNNTQYGSSNYLNIRNSNITLDGNGNVWVGTVANSETLAGFQNYIAETSLFTFSSSSSSGMSVQTDGSFFAGDGLGSAPFGKDATSVGWVVAQNGIATQGQLLTANNILDDGTGNVVISGSISSIGANLTLSVNNQSWVFDKYAHITVPEDNSGIGWITSNNFSIQTGYGVDNVVWSFGSDGRLTLPYNWQIVNIYGSPVFSEVALTGNYNNLSNVPFVTDYFNNIIPATSGNLLPSSNNSQNIGSPSLQWGSLFVSNGSIYIDGAKISSHNGNVVVGTGNTSVIISKSGNIILPANGSITDSVGKPVVETSVTSRNILNINIDGGIAAAIFSAIDNVYDGGGTSAAYGTYAPALDGADAYTDYSQTIGLDGGGAFAF